MKILIFLIFLIIQPIFGFWDYDDSFACLAFNLNDFEEDFILDSINLHYLDAISMVAIGAVALMLSSFIILTFLKYRQLRSQPGDIIFAISICEFLMTSHWMVSASYFIKYPDTPPKNKSNFCQVNSIISITTVSLEFLYNCAFCIYLNLKIRNVTKPTKIPFSLFHFTCIALAFILLAVMYFWDNLGKSILGTCSIKAVSAFPLTGPLIVLVYCFLAWGTIMNFKRKIPKNKKVQIVERGFMEYYFRYTRSCSILWSLLSASYLVVIFNCMYFQNDSLLIFTSITNILKLGTPFVLTLVRLRDPFLKYTLSKSFKSLKSRILILRNRSGASSYAPPNLNLFDELSANIKRIYVSTMVAGISYIFKVEDLKGKVIFDENCGYTSKFTLKINDSFLSQSLTNLVPEERCGISGKLIFHYPDIFKDIYLNDLLKPDIGNSFDPILNQEAIEKSSGADGGRGGELFVFSFDNKVILKTLTHLEFEEIKLILTDYKQHVCENPGSLFSRIYGLFSLIPDSSEPIYFIVMKNNVGLDSRYILKKFDMKGSTVDREVLKWNDVDEEEDFDYSKRVLKDTDFIKLEQTIKVKSFVKAAISSFSVLDSEFLMKKNIMDYSFFLIIVKIPEDEYHLVDHSFHEKIDEPGVFYKFAIIDYLQPFNFSKIFEARAKKLKKLSSTADISSVNPKDYCKRFQDFIMKILN